MLLAIYEWMKQHGPVTSSGIRAQFGLTDGKWRWHRELLEQQGCIEVCKRKGWWRATGRKPYVKPVAVIPVAYKVCQDCHTSKLTTDYHRSTKRRDGLAQLCKECMKVRNERARTRRAIYKPPQGNAAGVLLQELTCCWGLPREEERMAA